MKVCFRCKENKNLEDFHNNKRTKDNKESWCKLCMSTYRKQKRLDNLEHCRKRDNKNYWKSVDKNRLRSKIHARNNKEKRYEQKKVYAQNNIDKQRKWRRDFYNRHKEEISFKITKNLRGRISKAIKRGDKSDNTMSLIGCSIEDLITHIENQFQPGMTWENYGVYGWHLDHIQECYTFDLTKPEEQQKCFHYTNLRPLWAKDNLSRPKDLNKRPVIVA